MSEKKTPSRVSIFLSYAREDADILQAVTHAFEALRQKTYQYLDVFFDTKSIDAGDVFDDKIRAALRNADYLIILYTGRYKRSHSYTGFEVGYFASLMDDEVRTSGKPLRQIVPMYIDEPPGTLAGVQGVDLTVPVDDLSSNREAYMTRVRAAVNDDPLTHFFDSVGAEVEKRLPEGMVDKGTLEKDRIERIEGVRELVPVLRGDLYDCLSSREARRSIEQRLIIFELPKGSAKEADETIPDNATLTQRGKAFELFGVERASDTISWRDFKKEIISRSGNTNVATVLAIERAFISAVSPKITRDDSQIIRGFNDNLIYRLIVTQHFDYYDGRKVLYMYLIEIIGSIMFGDSKTSVLLGFINIAAKYRFIFIEPDSELSLESFKLEKRQKQPKELQGKVRQLVRELLLIEDESRALKLDTAASIMTYGQGLNINDMLELQKQWLDGRKKLVDKADEVLREDPGSDGFAEHFEKWLSVLEEFSSISHKVNSTITLQALENLKEAFR